LPDIEKSLDVTDSDLQGILQKLPSPLTLAAADRPDRPLVAANAAFLGLCGYALDEVAGRNCRFLQDGLDNDGARAEIRSALKDGRRTQVLLRNRRADGSEFSNHLTIVPIFADRMGAARYYLGAQFMVTEKEMHEFQHADAGDGAHDVLRAVADHRSVMLERRRVSIDAAVRLIESALLLKHVRRSSGPARGRG
jgi:PAS domain S-box-containing protein